MTLRCKPRELAVIVNMQPALADALGRFVTTKTLIDIDGEAAWILAEPVQIVLREGGISRGIRFKAGESCWFNTIPDRFLQPIRGLETPDDTATDTGTSAPTWRELEDDMIAWLGVGA